MNLEGSKIRFSLATLLMLITLAAVFGAAARGNSREWVHVAYTFQFSLILTSMLLAGLGRGSLRAFGLGTGLFGTCYVFVSGQVKSPLQCDFFLSEFSVEIARRFESLDSHYSAFCIEAMIGVVFAILGGCIAIAIERMVKENAPE